MNRLKVLKAEWLAVKARQAPLPPFTPEDLVGIDLANHLEEVQNLKLNFLSSQSCNSLFHFSGVKKSNDMT